MGKITLLDCTLRDGGYINDWRFGEDGIKDMTEQLCSTHVDVFEIGFLKNEPYQLDRTVFNDVDQITPLITPKDPKIGYAAMIEVVNPLPLERLKPCDGTSVDIIRVIVWKTKHDKNGNVVDALQEGFDYCKGVVERGYKLCVQPARVDQYTDEEFVDMVHQFSTLNPLAIYVVDSWGTQNPEQLLHYMHLADRNMPKEIALGYHGHNNLMQALPTAQQMISTGFDRDLMLDASVYGIGRGAGNLNLELIAKYLNEQYGKSYNVDPMLEVYEKYIKDIFAQEQWGYSVPYYLTAKYGCNPNYATYYAQKLLIPNENIEGVFQSMTDEEKTLYSPEKAIKLYQIFLQKKWQKKLCIIIPTANRPEVIDFYLRNTSHLFSEIGVTLVIFDSSDNYETEKIVKKYTCYAGSTTVYDRYTGRFDGVSLDHKVMAAYKKYAQEYEYVWACRDGHLINFAAIELPLFHILENNPDSVIVYHYDQNNMGLPPIKEYSDCQEILKDHCCHMAILGCSIFSSRFILDVLKNHPIDPIKNYGLWQPMAMFEYWAEHKPNVVSFVSNMFSINIHATPSSFWNKEGKALWQWGKRWCEMIDSLPECYNKVKKDIIHIGMADFTPFGPRQLMIMRANGSLSLKKYRENKPYLDRVTTMAPWKFRAVSCVPRFLIIEILKKNKGLLYSIARLGYRTVKKIYHVIKPPAEPIVPGYTLGNDRIQKSKVLKNVSINNKQMGIIIPTANRPDIIEAQFKSVIEMYESFGIDIIIWDSSDNDKTEKTVKLWNEKMNLHVRYERYTGEVDAFSIDKKVIAAYQQFMDEYEYLWVLRDRSGILMNNCIIDIMSAIKRKADTIILYNKNADYYGIGKAKYKDCKKLFREQFVIMTTLGNCIVKSSFIKTVLEENPLDQEKNYCLWQPVVFFEYYATHDFLVESLAGDYFLFHKSALQGSFWIRFLLYQWGERMYKILKNLPGIYADDFYDMLTELDNRYHLLGPSYLLKARAEGHLNIEDVKKYRDILPTITPTPMAYFDEIVTMSRRKAKYYLKHFAKHPEEYVKKYGQTDHSQLGYIQKPFESACLEETH